MASNEYNSIFANTNQTYGINSSNNNIRTVNNVS